MDSDFLIVGGGIAGATAAYHLTPHGRVTLLERESQPGYHATGRSAAIFVENYGTTTVRRVTRAGRAFLETPPDGFSDHPLMRARGTLTIAGHEHADRLAGVLAESLILSPDSRLIDADEAVALVPGLKREWLAGAVLDPFSWDMDVHAILTGYLRGAQRHGARIEADAEVGALARVDGHWVARTRNGDHRAPILINAAGAWGDALARLAGVAPLGLQPLRRTALTFDPGLPVATWPMVQEIGEQFYFKPEAGHLMLSLADETPSEPCDAQPDEYDLAVAVDRMEQATTMTVRRMLSKWAGLRSFLPDRTPCAGFDPVAPGFFWLIGQGGYGIHTSPALGAATAALATGGAWPESLVAAGVTAADLDPARPSLAAASEAQR